MNLGLSIQDDHEGLWLEAEMITKRHRRQFITDSEDNATIPSYEGNLWRVEVKVSGTFSPCCFSSSSFFL